MRWKLLTAVIATLVGFVVTAAPAEATIPTGCNWACPMNVDAWEYRNPAKITLGTAWSIGTASEGQDACYMLIVNTGTNGHYMRMQIIKRSTGSVIYDSGFHGIYLGPGNSAVRNPHISPEPFSAEIYVKAWNDVGNTTYNDYETNVSDDTVTTYEAGHYDCT